MEQPHSSCSVAQRRSDSFRRSYRGSLCASRRNLTSQRRLNTSRRAPKPRDITEKVNPEQLALLLNTEWKLSYVTPLYQFSYTQLKTYSSQLSAFITAERHPGLAVEVGGSQSSFRVSFSVVQGMTEDNDPETILIQIHQTPFHARPDKPQKSVWSGWLSCSSGNSDYLQSLPNDFICLPLFGSNGPEVLTTSVKSWFQQAFDCCFGSLEISHICLQWLAALWTNCHPESNIRKLEMIWSLPVVPRLDITYSVHPQDAWELWSNVRKDLEEENGGEEEGGDRGTIDIQEVMKFMEMLKNHFYRHFKLNLAAGNLSQVSTALGSAKYSGSIKISNSRYMITTLALLTECALLKMPI